VCCRAAAHPAETAVSSPGRAGRASGRPKRDDSTGGLSRNFSPGAWEWERCAKASIGGLRYARLAREPLERGAHQALDAAIATHVGAAAIATTWARRPSQPTWARPPSQPTWARRRGRLARHRALPVHQSRGFVGLEPSAPPHRLRSCLAVRRMRSRWRAQKPGCAKRASLDEQITAVVRAAQGEQVPSRGRQQ
jgi:hypothetical protein